MLVREPLVRASLPPTVVDREAGRSRSGFEPQRIFAERSPGVVTVFSYFRRQAGRLDARGRLGVRRRPRRDRPHRGARDRLGSAFDDALGCGPARAVYVQFSDGDRVRAHIVGWDPYDDVGVLRVPPAAHALVPVPLGDSADVAVGAAGGGDRLAVRRRRPRSRSASISGVDRTIPSLTTPYNLFDAIQTDAPINQGNSGGPLARRRR